MLYFKIRDLYILSRNTCNNRAIDIVVDGCSFFFFFFFLSLAFSCFCSTCFFVVAAVKSKQRRAIVVSTCTGIIYCVNGAVLYHSIYWHLYK